MAKSGPHIWAFIACYLLLILHAAPLAGAHSAVERLLRIAPNGTTIGAEGFPRGFWPRDDPNFHDIDLTYLIPQGRQYLLPDDKLAPPFQRTSNYTAAHPPLKAAPGDLIVLQYQENGHVTLPNNQKGKPLNRGTVYIYGTSDFDNDANLLDIHYKWTPDGTGGDGKGRLLATRNFDDGQCYQDNDGDISTQRKQKFSKSVEQPMGVNLWCQNDIALPDGLPVGQNYTVIWLWDWPYMDSLNVSISPSSAPGAPPAPGGSKVTQPELYSTIIDIEIVDPCDDVLGPVKAPTCSKGGATPQQKYVVSETDLNKAAIQPQLLNMFFVDWSAVFSSGNNTNSPVPSLSPSNTDGTGSAVTSTVTDIATVQTTVTTVTHIGTAPSSPSGPSIKTVTVTTYSTTVTETVAPSASISTSDHCTESFTTSTRSSGTGGPDVTHFLKDSEPSPTTTTATATAANKGRRQVGQWGFGADGRHGV